MPQPTIASYMQRLQRILGDAVFERFNPFDLLDYVNEARGVVASMGECCRALCPSTAGVAGSVVVTPGQGYTTAPAVTFSSPNTGVGVTTTGFANINVGLGTVISVTVSNPGSGYTIPPTITLSGGGGLGATATCSLLPFAQAIAGQEVYQLTSFNNLVQSLAIGLDSIIAIRSLAVAWGTTKPVLRYFEWGDFQAYLRASSIGFSGNSPSVWSQYGRGTTGSFYLWPVPSQNAQMDLDCICLPSDLDTLGTTAPEPIPYPYTNAVPYKAAQIAVLGHPDLRDLADRYENHFMRRMDFATSAVFPARVPDYYNPSSGI